VSELERRVPPGASLLADTSVVIAYIGGSEPTSSLARLIFDGFAATGRNPVALSAVTVTELLVRPFQRGAGALVVAEGFLRHFAELRIVAIDYDVAREAARLRAGLGLPTPDALIVASAVVAGDDLIVTSDRTWASRLASDPRCPPVVTLGDVPRPRRGR
jgi:predicted nucleic acid-binding protein